MKSKSARMVREQNTINAMFRVYCQAHHASPVDICPDCRDLVDYAATRLDRCPFQDAKPTCAKCLVHCYKPEMRQRVREVMRFAGPRMLLKHPVLAVLHLLDGLRKPQPLKKNQA